jgi:NAD-dependent dihydropyrimidine dehydrogenase PreA subunit
LLGSALVIGTKDTGCVDVCPVACIHPKNDETEFEGVEQILHRSGQVYRLQCFPLAQISAIVALEDLPEKKWAHFVEINAN